MNTNPSKYIYLFILDKERDRNAQSVRNTCFYLRLLKAAVLWIPALWLSSFLVQNQAISSPIEEEEAALNAQPCDLCNMSRLIYPTISTTCSILVVGINTTKYNLSTLIIPLNVLTI